VSRWPALIHLTGAPAAGKRTVAEALVEEANRRGHRSVLVDNHLVSRPILTVIDSDGVRTLPPEVWPHVHAVHREVLATIEALSPPDWSFVFTNYLLEGKGRGEAAVASIRALAASRGSAYLPVALRCDLDELLRRVPNADRREHLKWIDPDAVRDELEQWPVLVPEGALTIDTTSRPPHESAALILDALDG
jgi:chloramphenicol 3-O-phosphotransferase